MALAELAGAALHNPSTAQVLCNPPALPRKQTTVPTRRCSSQELSCWLGLVPQQNFLQPQPRLGGRVSARDSS